MKISINKTLVTCLILSVSTVSYAQKKIEDNSSLNTAKIPDSFQVQRDLVHKTVDGQKLTFDFIQSKNSKDNNSPLLIHIHGGGWKGGSKEAFYRRLFFDAARPLIEKGMKVATVNYRLTKKGESTTVESVTDCKDAIRFFAANAKRFGVDPKRFILMGGSAGGHLTLMTALAPDADYPPIDPKLNE
ncbi:MAG: alpha/beta hydrolase, partial [Verrucomicrobia bacterium]|nr:alpha/beta hydrolase [Verrucomicrobiota bacterium]